MSVKQLLIYNLYYLSFVSLMLGWYLFMQAYPKSKIAQHCRLMPASSLVVSGFVFMYIALKAF